MEKTLEDQLIERFTLATFLESVRLFEEGIAGPEDIDIAMRAGAGLPLGPFAWADREGLDVILNRLEKWAQSLPGFEPPVSLRQRVARGDLGVKTGRGYLRYGKEAVE
ncbi:Enoyl-CoA hydratase/isomerase [Sulfobacillus acidophilus TPY]|uniref:3-hydroxyacyl-CoA dehydrogenase domain-containing protein n=1 Tax=Sulfobacillus acidophilus (strain ATCC 700253 / DSM 10332 / NAL) TaxID=679936 RepID=G8TVR5_SULAD|nr:Enoyl-CoA hydratase/isomerase [Sulfobacillus acidophilus TPY]AEW03704.1 3-hydroxyacyl-CoA dehydrogenase domain-containing protein [Sulfobacillus acidophilus DSM 10332]